MRLKPQPQTVIRMEVNDTAGSQRSSAPKGSSQMPELPSSYSIATSQLDTGSKVTYSSKQVGKKGDLLPSGKMGVNSPRSKQHLPTILKGSANSMLGDPLDESEDQEAEDEYSIDEGLSSIQNAHEIKSGTLSPPDNLISGTGVPM